MPLMIFNTASSREERFFPVRKHKVGLYVCGPTTYDLAHVGHGRSYLFYDVVKRYLQYLGYKVKHVQNFTDMDDNIVRRGLLSGVKPLDLAAKYIDEFLYDMDTLRVQRADVYPKTTEHIDDCIEWTDRMIKKGVAYEVEGDVYFNAHKNLRFGKLIHEELEDVVVDDLTEVKEENLRRRSFYDFAVWKRAKPWEIAWNSPWGLGRPGWHTECAVMSHKYIGSTVDIHGGGVDLIFPHHESEALISEALSGRTSTKYWMHNQFVTFDGEKMSKSKDNLVTIRDAIKKAGPDTLRFYLMSSQYRKRLNFSLHRLEVAKGTLKRYQRIISRTINEDRKKHKDVNSKAIRTCVSDFFRAMDSDFDTSRAIASIRDLVRLMDGARLKGRTRAKLERALRCFQDILGFDLGLGFDGEN